MKIVIVALLGGLFLCGQAQAACSIFETCVSLRHAKNASRKPHQHAVPASDPSVAIRIKSLEEQVVELRRQQLLTQIQLSAWVRSIAQAHSRIDAIGGGK